MEVWLESARHVKTGIVPYVTGVREYLPTAYHRVQVLY